MSRLCSPSITLSELNPKVCNYQTNGTGRDTYIRADNGGFFKGGERPKPITLCIDK